MINLLIRVAMIIAVATPAMAQRPNIVVIMTDDQTDIETLQTMPILRREMAQKGVVFKSSFTDFPLCCPSRTSFLTGLAAHNHGVVWNVAVGGGGYAKFYSQGWERKTLAVWLRRAGYRTALIGKYLNQFPLAAGLPLTHKPVGWHGWVPYLNGSYFNYRVNLHGKVVWQTEYMTDFFTRVAVNFIRAQAGKPEPFFLLLTPVAPHNDVVPNANGLKLPTPAARHKGKFARWPFPRPPRF